MYRPNTPPKQNKGLASAHAAQEAAYLAQNPGSGQQGYVNPHQQQQQPGYNTYGTHDNGLYGHSQMPATPGGTGTPPRYPTPPNLYAQYAAPNPLVSSNYPAYVSGTGINNNPLYGGPYGYGTSQYPQPSHAAAPAASGQFQPHTGPYTHTQPAGSYNQYPPCTNQASNYPSNEQPYVHGQSGNDTYYQPGPPTEPTLPSDYHFLSPGAKLAAQAKYQAALALHKVKLAAYWASQVQQSSSGQHSGNMYNPPPGQHGADSGTYNSPYRSKSARFTISQDSFPGRPGSDRSQSPASRGAKGGNQVGKPGWRSQA